MDVIVQRVGGLRAASVWSITRRLQLPSYPYAPFKPRCSNSKDNSRNGNNNEKGDRVSTDWDKDWSTFRKQGKKPPFSQFTPNKYVSWNPRRTEYPLSEEIDPIKRTERSNLVLWTSPKFTLAGTIVMVSMLLLYTLLPPLK